MCIVIAFGKIPNDLSIQKKRGPPYCENYLVFDDVKDPVLIFKIIRDGCV